MDWAQLRYFMREVPRGYLAAGVAGISHTLLELLAWLSTGGGGGDSELILAVLITPRLCLLIGSILLLAVGEHFRLTVVVSCFVLILPEVSTFNSETLWHWWKTWPIALLFIVLACLLPDLIWRGLSPGEARLSLLILVFVYFILAAGLNVIRLVMEEGFFSLLYGIVAPPGISDDDSPQLVEAADAFLYVFRMMLNVVLYCVKFHQVLFLILAIRAIALEDPSARSDARTYLVLAVALQGGLALLFSGLDEWERWAFDILAVACLLGGTSERQSESPSLAPPQGNRELGLDLKTRVRCPGCSWEPGSREAWHCPDCNHCEWFFVPFYGCSLCSSEWQMLVCPSCNKKSERAAWYENFGLGPVCSSSRWSL